VAQTETVLYSFTGPPDGEQPLDSLIVDARGNLYGTTNGGGFEHACCGTVFKVTPAGAEKVLYTFTLGADGANPETAGVVLDKQGNLYGTTVLGGTGCRGSGCGVVFELTAAGKEKVLYRFRHQGYQGSANGLILDAGGNLYGTTASGGAGGWGTVFEVTPPHSKIVLYNFTNGADGGNPQSGLILDAEGNLYGTTSQGGVYGYGTVFELSATGTETVLYSFTGGADGGFPLAGLVRDANGNLYGTTYEGGAYGFGDMGYGTVFELSQAGKETVLYSFTGGADGGNPQGGLVRDKQGNLYGTTVGGGVPGCVVDMGCGVVFEVAADGTEQSLYGFTGGADGANPIAGLVLDKKGNLYGTTELGGASGFGTVFKVVP
jgi:uncharacterized repeat protein (TIGR03803 family)